MEVLLKEGGDVATLYIKGESYRLKEKRKAGLLGQAPKPEEPATTTGE